MDLSGGLCTQQHREKVPPSKAASELEGHTADAIEIREGNRPATRARHSSVLPTSSSRIGSGTAMRGDTGSTDALDQPAADPNRRCCWPLYELANPSAP